MIYLNPSCPKFRTVLPYQRRKYFNLKISPFVKGRYGEAERGFE